MDCAGSESETNTCMPPGPWVRISAFDGLGPGGPPAARAGVPAPRRKGRSPGVPALRGGTRRTCVSKPHFFAIEFIVRFLKANALPINVPPPNPFRQKN